MQQTFVHISYNNVYYTDYPKKILTRSTEHKRAALRDIEILVVSTLLVLCLYSYVYKVINKYCAEMHLIEIVGMFIVEPSHGVWQLVLDLSFLTDMSRLRHDPS